jgi:hypothetical protein
MEFNRGWWVVAALAVVQLAYVTFAPRSAGTTYVLTPVVDIVPGGSPLEASEAQAIVDQLSAPQDARDMQKAYAQLGSTLSLHDLLRGVESLTGSDVPLSSQQKQGLDRVLKEATANHQELAGVQAQILDLERKLSEQVAHLERTPPQSPEEP